MSDAQISIPPLPQEDIDRLGNQLAQYERPAKTKWKRMGISIVLAAIGITFIVINVVTYEHWIYFSFGIIPLFFAWAVYIDTGILLIALYEQGIVTFRGKGLPRVYFWEDSFFGECEWSGGVYDFSISNAIPRKGTSFNSKDINCDAQEFREWIFEYAYPSLRKKWSKAVRENLEVDQGTIVIKRAGVYFKEIKDTLPWEDVVAFGVNGTTWKQHFILPNGKKFETKLAADDVPWIELLFRFAEEVRMAQDRMKNRDTKAAKNPKSAD